MSESPVQCFFSLISVLHPCSLQYARQASSLPDSSSLFTSQRFPSPLGLTLSTVCHRICARTSDRGEVAHTCMFTHARVKPLQASLSTAAFSFLLLALLRFVLRRLYFKTHMSCCDPARADSVRFSLGLGGSQQSERSLSNFKVGCVPPRLLQPCPCGPPLSGTVLTPFRLY